MPFSVSYSFSEYRSKTVDLDADETKKARTSRDYLEGQISLLPIKDQSFPRLYGGYQYFGSFSRKTKARPLDDIDFMVLLDGKNTSGNVYSGYSYKITVTDKTSVLWQYADIYGVLSSTRVLNKFKSSLQTIPSYKNSDLKRNGEAVVLNLTSYAWSFDIVPSFPASNSSYDKSISFYYIPDGNGNWKKTDPRIDQNSITTTNGKHNGNLIPLIRLIKYWNANSRAASRMGSYHLETMMINAFKYQPAISEVRKSVPFAFGQIASLILSNCPDPKGFGPNLDNYLDMETKLKIRTAAQEMEQFSNWALMYESSSNDKDAIYWWGRVFPNFPPYG
jgi:hypothetical protein